VFLPVLEHLLLELGERRPGRDLLCVARLACASLRVRHRVSSRFVILVRPGSPPEHSSGTTRTPPCAPRYHPACPRHGRFAAPRRAACFCAAAHARGSETSTRASRSRLCRAAPVRFY